jgi:glycerate kinase
VLRVLAAPNAFKGSLDAPGVAEAMARGVGRACPGAVVRHLPVADGGDGTGEVLRAALQGVSEVCAVPDAWGRHHRARLVLLPGGDAVVELASACGLGRRRPGPEAALTASSLGVGRLVAAALARGARHVWVALGGSASTDGGAGLLRGLGARLLTSRGAPPPDGGGGLPQVAAIDLSGLPWRGSPPITALVDVDNPLLGPRGAARAFGPQKGADAPAVERLEAALAHWAGVAEAAAGRACRDLAGAGAAGGCGFGLALLGVRLRPGGEAVAQLLDLDGALEWADLVLTGEGGLDAQTANGKAPGVVAAHAAAAGVPAIALAGALGPGWRGLLRPEGPFCACLALGQGPRSRWQALAGTANDVEDAAETAVRLFVAGRGP